MIPNDNLSPVTVGDNVLISGVDRRMIGALINIQWDLERALTAAEQVQKETMDRLDESAPLPGDGPISLALFQVVKQTNDTLVVVRALMDKLQCN